MSIAKGTRHGHAYPQNTLPFLIALVVSGLVVAGSLSALPVPRTLADKIAQDWSYLHGYHLEKAGWNPAAGAAEPGAVFVGELKDDSGAVAAYKYRFPTGGEVVVVNEDTLAPIFFYDEKNAFDPNANPTAHDLFQWMVANIQCAKRNSNSVVHDKWSRIINQANQFRAQGALSCTIAQGTTGPLLETKWDQGDPDIPTYNFMCPLSSGKHCIVGCVATAMAQIMRYWCYPPAGQGSVDHVIVDGVNVSMNVDFSTPAFDWSNMPTTITSQSSSAEISAIARLSYYCGASVYMDYGLDSSGVPVSHTYMVRDAFVNNFLYPSNAAYLERDQTSNWETLMQDQLGRGQPVMYMGIGMGGHAFVLDGVQAGSTNDMYHFNLGWSGQCDGWYTIDTTNGPCGDLFPYSQMAVINVGNGKKLSTIVYPSEQSGELSITPHGTSFFINSSVQIEAIPNWGNVFDHWEGSVTGTQNPITITMDADKTITAVFKTGYRVHFKKIGNGGDNISNNNNFNPDDIATVQALPDAGWAFDHWEGSLTGKANPSTLKMDCDKLVIGVFTQSSRLTLIQAGAGSITTDPQGVFHKKGTRVKLTATADSGWTFRKWWGDLDIADNHPVIITMDTDKTVQAEFVKVGGDNVPLAVVTVGQGQVTPFGGSFLRNAKVTLTATAADGWSFYQWRGMETPVADNPLVVTMDQVKTITAVFVQSGSQTPAATTAMKSDGVVRVDATDEETLKADTEKDSGFSSADLINSCTLFSIVPLAMLLAAFVALVRPLKE